MAKRKSKRKLPRNIYWDSYHAEYVAQVTRNYRVMKISRSRSLSAVREALKAYLDKHGRPRRGRPPAPAKRRKS